MADGNTSVDFDMPIEGDDVNCDAKYFAVPILFTMIATVGIIANSVVIFIITVLK